MANDSSVQLWGVPAPTMFVEPLVLTGVAGSPQLGAAKPVVLPVVPVLVPVDPVDVEPAVEEPPVELPLLLALALVVAVPFDPLALDAPALLVPTLPPELEPLLVEPELEVAAPVVEPTVEPVVEPVEELAAVEAPLVPLVLALDPLTLAVVERVEPELDDDALVAVAVVAGLDEQFTPQTASTTPARVRVFIAQPYPESGYGP